MTIVRRCFGIILAVVINAGAGEAAAQEPAADQTTVVGQTCLVDADPNWTPQEIWTWRRICIGFNADLAVRPAGAMYPQQMLDLRSVSDALRDPRQAGSWPADRTLRASFLEEILLHEPYRSALTHNGIHIYGARFRDWIDLSNTAITRNLEIGYSAFDQDVGLWGIRSDEGVSFTGSRFAGVINLQLARIGGDLDLTGATAVSVLLDDATIDNKLFAKGLATQNVLRMDSLNVKSDIYLQGADVACMTLEEAEVANAVLMQGARVRFNANLQGLKVGSNVMMTGFVAERYQRPTDRSQIPPCAFAQAPPQPGEQGDPMLAAQFVSLRDSRVGGSIMIDDAFVGPGIPLDLTDVKVGAHVMLRGARRFDQVIVSGADIGGLLLLHGSTFAGPLEIQSIKVGKAISAGPNQIMNDSVSPRSARCKSPEFAYGIWGDGAQVQGDLRIQGARLLGTLELRGAQVVGALQLGDGARFDKPVDLTFARVGSNLDLTRGEFSSVDLTGTVIGAELRLATSSSDRPTISSLVVRNVTAKALQDIPEVWPDKVELEGFTYAQLGGFRSNPSVAIPPDPCMAALADRTVQRKATVPSAEGPGPTHGICGWLRQLKGSGSAAGADVRRSSEIESRGACEFVDWLGKQDAYSPQPYAQLASVLQRSGQPEKARWVLFEGKYRERNEASWLRWIGLSIEMLLTGFGLYPWIAGGWAILLIAVGTRLLRYDGCPHLEHFRLSDRIVYSIDMLLPFIELKKGNYEFDLYSWPKYYFYLHKVMGYVLVGFVIASIGGLPGE